MHDMLTKCCLRPNAGKHSGRLSGSISTKTLGILTTGTLADLPCSYYNLADGCHGSDCSSMPAWQSHFELRSCTGAFPCYMPRMQGLCAWMSEEATIRQEVAMRVHFRYELTMLHCRVPRLRRTNAVCSRLLYVAAISRTFVQQRQQH